MSVTFTDEQRRIVQTYYPGLGSIPPSVGSGGLLTIIADAVDAEIAVVQAEVDALTSTGGAAAAGSGVTVVESLGVVRAVLTLVDTPVVMADNAGVVAYGSLKVLDLPASAVLFLGAVADLALTKSSAGVNATWDGDIGLGSVAANNGNALATTEQDFIPTTPTPQAVSGVTTGDMQSTSTEVAKVFASGTDVYLNILVDDADHDVTGTPCNIIVNGTITFSYVKLG
jgi:hypothetical protein